MKYERWLTNSGLSDEHFPICQRKSGNRGKRQNKKPKAFIVVIGSVQLHLPEHGNFS